MASVFEAVREAHALVILTDWEEPVTPGQNSQVSVEGAIVAIAPPASVRATDAPIAQAITPDIFRASTPTCVPELVRPHVRGKFLFVGDEKFYIRGVSYGAFQPDASGREYHDRNVIERDFAQMAANGINTVRIPHTMPPRSLLGAARRHGLRVMVGLSAEQYLGFLIDRDRKSVV